MHWRVFNIIGGRAIGEDSDPSSGHLKVTDFAILGNPDFLWSLMFIFTGSDWGRRSTCFESARAVVSGYRVTEFQGG